MKTLYNRRYRGGNGERRSFAFFAVGGLAVLAAVFVIGLQVGRYVEKTGTPREGQADRPARDNAADIRKDLGAFSEEAAGVRAVPPPDAKDDARATERSVTFPETLARKDPGPMALVRPRGAKAAAGRPAAPPDKPFLVQSAVFRNKGSAQDMRARLLKAGFPAKIVESRGTKGVLFRVLVGPFAARDAAVKTVRKLKSEMKIDAVIVRG
ncbi:MAG: SPOR domain-containing protein [Gemmatimonadota bacterium]